MNLFELLLEAIDNPNLDGVIKNKLSNKILYLFQDTESEKAVEAYHDTGVPVDYLISIYFDDQIYLAKEIREIDPGLRYYDVINAEDANAKPAEVSLKGQDSFSLTALNNWSFVYNKLAGAVIDSVMNEGVNVLTFSGFVIGMDLIYLKMMNRFNKMLNNDSKFVQISEITWMQKHLLENADDSEKYGPYSAKSLLNMSYQAFQGYAGEYMKKYKSQRRSKFRGT